MQTQDPHYEPLRSAPSKSLDRLLLDEANHRVANEVAAALAALTLARTARGAHSRDRLLDAATERLEAFGDASRIIAGIGGGKVEAGPLLERLCQATFPAGGGGGPARIVLDLPACPVPGEVARWAAVIGYELVTNARKHAFREPGGELVVRLSLLAGCLVLTVSDDGPGVAVTHSPSAGSGLGSRIVAEIVATSGGSVECDTGPHGTTIHVSLPIR